MPTLPSYAPFIDAVAPSLLALRDTRFPATAIAWRDDLALTVAHVMGRGAEGRVVMPDGTEAKATLVGANRRADLAVIKINAPLTPARLAPSQPISVGDLTLVVGRPVGDVRAAIGMVQTVGGPWRTPRGASMHRFIDVDAGFPPGFSGGPLLAGDGGVVGINTSMLIRGGATIPIESAIALAEALVRGEDPRPGFLGAALQRAPLSSSQKGESDTESGLLVTGLTKDGPAQNGGIQVGDILLAIDDDALPSVDVLLHALLDRGGKDAAFTVLRGNDRTTLTLTLGVRSARGCR